VIYSKRKAVVSAENMHFPLFGVFRYEVVTFISFFCITGIVLGNESQEIETLPLGMVSITRGIDHTGSYQSGGENCNFAGNIVLGGFFSLESDDKFFTIGSQQLTAYNLMVDQINRHQCGVTLKELGLDNTVTERNYALELRVYDDQSSTNGSSAIAGILAEDPSVDIMLGGYSSTLTQPFMETAHNSSEKLVLAAGASLTKVYANKDLAFGLLPPSTKYLSLAVEALATIHGAKTVATVWEDTSFTRAACKSAPELAEQNGMTMISTTEVGKAPNTTILEPIAESLKGEDPDVVITCVYDCNPWIQAMRRANWSPKAQVFTICVGQENFSSQAGSDTAYIMGVTPWDSSLQIKDSVTGWSASEFASHFRSASREDENADVPYQAAMAASLISMLHQTIEGVNDYHQNGPQLANFVSKNTFQTMGGNLAFDDNGQLKAPSLTLQYDAEGVVQTVYPPDASSGPMLYPMPTWDHRDCINLSGCEGRKENFTVDSFYTGNTCDDIGLCVCGDPYNFRAVGSGASANCIQLENMNYIDRRLKVLSWFLGGSLIAFCVYCLGWTYYYRENSLVKVSQPLFLALVAVGTIMSILSMFTVGIEASYREETENIWVADTACMASPWLWGMGFAITYSALFAKVWRVYKLYKISAKMRRQAVDYKDVYFIIIIVLLTEVIVLTAYQMLSPRIWHRDVVEDINGYPIESIGKCYSENQGLFQCALVILKVICLFVALVLCWRTKDLPSDFSESSYIFLAVMFMFQILLMTVPITQMAQQDRNVNFFIKMGGVFLQNFSVVMLIFLPKMRRIFIGEDTTMSIKNAIAGDMNRRESANRQSSFISATAPRLRSTYSRDRDSLDSIDLASNDSMHRTNSLVIEGCNCGRTKSMIDVEEVRKPKSFERTNKTEDSNDEEIANDKSGDYKMYMIQDDKNTTDKQLRCASWRYEASSGDSASV